MVAGDRSKHMSVGVRDAGVAASAELAADRERKCVLVAEALYIEYNSLV